MQSGNKRGTIWREPALAGANQRTSPGQARAARSWTSSRRQQQGIAYLGLMFAVLFMGMAIGTSIEGWSTSAQRAREAELLWSGNEYRKAIRNYYELSPGGNKQYPKSLDDLLEDKRFVTIQRHLRKRYLDPFTGKADWTLITDPNGQIIGVASKSPRKPLKVGNFSKDDKDFKDKSHYSDWKFTYTPNLAPPGAPGSNPGGNPGQPPVTPPGLTQ